jgi:hypothetical protein
VSDLHTTPAVTVVVGGLVLMCVADVFGGCCGCGQRLMPFLATLIVDQSGAADLYAALVNKVGG